MNKKVMRPLTEAEMQSMNGGLGDIDVLAALKDKKTKAIITLHPLVVW